MYEEICGCGGVSPEYFLDHMSIGECLVFLRGMRRKQRKELESIRLIMWSIFQSQSTRSLDLDEVLKLGEENEDDEEADSEGTAEERERELQELRERAKSMKL